MNEQRIRTLELLFEGLTEEQERRIMERLQTYAADEAEKAGGTVFITCWLVRDTSNE